MRIFATLALGILILMGCESGSHRSSGDSSHQNMSGTLVHGDAGSTVAHMKQMNDEMAAELRIAGPKHDEDFLNLMLEHHRGAVLMAEVALMESQRPEIRRISAEIISAQKKEIAQLEDWRQQWYGY